MSDSVLRKQAAVAPSLATESSLSKVLPPSNTVERTGTLIERPFRIEDDGCEEELTSTIGEDLSTAMT